MKFMANLHKQLLVQKWIQGELLEIGIDESNFEVMVNKACMDSVIPAFKPLNQQDRENKMEYI